MAETDFKASLSSPVVSLNSTVSVSLPKLSFSSYTILNSILSSSILGVKKLYCFIFSFLVILHFSRGSTTLTIISLSRCSTIPRHTFKIFSISQNGTLNSTYKRKKDTVFILNSAFYKCLNKTHSYLDIYSYNTFISIPMTPNSS